MTSRFLRVWFELLTNPIEQRNWSFFGLICAVENLNELDSAIKQTNMRYDVVKTTTKLQTGVLQICNCLLYYWPFLRAFLEKTAESGS